VTLARLPEPDEAETPPEWTKLDVCCCANCPLTGQVE